MCFLIILFSLACVETWGGGGGACFFLFVSWPFWCWCRWRRNRSLLRWVELGFCWSLCHGPLHGLYHCWGTTIIIIKIRNKHVFIIYFLFKWAWNVLLFSINFSFSLFQRWIIRILSVLFYLHRIFVFWANLCTCSKFFYILESKSLTPHNGCFDWDPRSGSKINPNHKTPFRGLYILSMLKCTNTCIFRSIFNSCPNPLTHLSTPSTELLAPTPQATGVDAV